MPALRLSLSGEPVWAAERAVVERFEGVGLIRSEYLLRRTDEFVTRPGAREMIATYVERVARHLDPAPVWYRTTDFWSPEANALVGIDVILNESDPAVGLRGIRRAISYPDAFREELAIVSGIAARYANLHLLFPFVGNANEFSFALDEARRQSWPNRIGCMIEIPAAVLDAHRIIRAGATNLLVGLNDLSALMTGAARSSRFGGKMHPAVWTAVDCVRREVGSECEWGIGGDLTPEVLEEAERHDVPYATLHYCHLPQLLGIDPDALPEVEYVSESKRKTRAVTAAWRAAQREVDRQ